uniref:Uncharacterized protein n=1 Tax=Bionectria ochroleuca TaxID=29856 RepID=A0A8H7TUA1_BIOOC
MAGNGPFTIRQSFDIALPEARREDGAPGRRTYNSSQTSEGTYFPPSVALGLDVIVWLDLADEILTTTTSQRIDCAYLATWEADNRVLRTEGDVVDASSCQLFNPVNLALTSFYRHENVVMLNEHNATVDGADNRSRVDRAWTLEGDWEHPFAVLEAKRSGTILPQQYERAIQEGFHHRASGEPIQSRETTFLENSYELMAQAARYSVKYYTPYVALFDWDHLVLAVMEQASGTNGGTYCWLTVVSERRLMRRALLGFLHGAYKEVVSRDRFLPPPVHFAVKELPARKKPSRLLNTRAEVAGNLTALNATATASTLAALHVGLLVTRTKTTLEWRSCLFETTVMMIGSGSTCMKGSTIQLVIGRGVGIAAL